MRTESSSSGKAVMKGKGIATRGKQRIQFYLEESRIGSNTETLPNCSACQALEQASGGGADELFGKRFRNRLVNCLLEKALINLAAP